MNYIVSVRETAFAQIDLKNATIYIRDGDTPQNSIEVKIGEGNLTWTEARNVEYTLDRGELDEVKLGDEIPVEVSFDFTWEYLKGATGSNTPTIEDALKNRGEADDWVSSDADVCRPYAVDIVIRYVPNCASGNEEQITLADFRWESLDHDLRNGTVAVSGRCNITEPTVARNTQSSGS
jgi:hypothetical protein